MSSSAVRLIRRSRSRTTSGSSDSPGCEVECRPTGVESAVAPDDVRDGFGLDFAFRPLGVVVDVEVEQGVGVLVDQRPREVGLVLPIAHLDERLDVDEAQLLADTLRLPVRPLLGWNDPHRHADPKQQRRSIG